MLMSSVVWTWRYINFISTVHLQFNLEVCWSISSNICYQIIKIPKHTHICKYIVYVCVTPGGRALCTSGLLQTLLFQYSNTDTVSQFMMQQFNITLTGCKKKNCGEVYKRRPWWMRAYWDCGFESHWENRHLSLVSVVCCQVEVPSKGWSLVQNSPTECLFCLSVIRCNIYHLDIERVGRRGQTWK
jgi:hypothetical protein